MKFSDPLQPNQVEWKIQSWTKDKSKTIVVPYIDARACYERFDECFGPMNWSTEFRETKAQKTTKEGPVWETGHICKLSVKVREDFVSREEGCSSTDIEPIKGGISGSFKRACHAFGLGRELYDYPRVMIGGEHRFISLEHQQMLEDLTRQFNEGKLNKPVYVL